jgi:hypothetical protein
MCKFTIVIIKSLSIVVKNKMDILTSLFDPCISKVEVSLNSTDLHEDLMKLMIQCIGHKIGETKNDKVSFNLMNVTDITMQEVTNAFRKMNIAIQIVDLGQKFRDPPDIRHSDLDTRVTHIVQISKKVRFVFILPGNTSCAAAQHSVF